MSTRTRVTLDLSPEDYARLRKLANDADTTSAAVLRNALYLLEYFSEKSANGVMVVVDAQGTRHEIVMPWEQKGAT